MTFFMYISYLVNSYILIITYLIKFNYVNNYFNLLNLEDVR